ncbi:MAG: helix-turn-helix transcriptional regulator [Polyangiaceae bacterium]|nr:helix-turn-helix transcriptional regulator [Polyangiaceae bacterium]
MIRNEREERETRERLDDFRSQIEETRRVLTEQTADAESIELAVQPLQVLAAELEYDLDFYGRLRQEGVSAVPNYPPDESGKELIALRVARGWTQRKLAEELGVSEAQVSRDERNDYQGISQERRARLLEALGVEERREFRSKRPLPEGGVVIELPVWRAEAASFSGPVPTLTIDKKTG